MVLTRRPRSRPRSPPRRRQISRPLWGKGCNKKQQRKKRHESATLGNTASDGGMLRLEWGPKDSPRNACIRRYSNNFLSSCCTFNTVNHTYLIFKTINCRQTTKGVLAHHAHNSLSRNSNNFNADDDHAYVRYVQVT